MAGGVNIKNLKPIEYTATPTIDTNSYASGDLVGTLMTFSGLFKNIKEGRIVGVRIVDLAKQDANLDLILFANNPSNTTFTDNAALDVNDTDILTSYKVSITDYTDFADNSLGQNFSIDIPISNDDFEDDHDLYACLVSRGTPTYSASSDLKVYIYFMEY